MNLFNKILRFLLFLNTLPNNSPHCRKYTQLEQIYKCRCTFQTFSLIFKDWRRKEYSTYSTIKSGSLLELVTSCLGNAFKTLLKGREKEEWKWWEDEEEDLSSYWMTLMKRKDTGNWTREHHIALCGEFSLEEALDLAEDRLQGEYGRLVVDCYVGVSVYYFVLSNNFRTETRGRHSTARIASGWTAAWTNEGL